MNNTMFIARSLTFYPGYFEDNFTELSDEIILPSYHLNKIMESFEDDEMLYINIINTETTQNHLVAIGAPHNYDKNTIFAPQWILDIIGCSGCCDSVILVEKAEVKDIPAATKIIIKPLDPIAFDINTHECFENAFMNLHSIKQGLTIPIPVPQLGKDYQMYAYIEKVEPESISLIVHGEVDVEFINDFKSLEPLIVPTIPILEPSIPDSSNKIITPSAPPPDNPEERRKTIRESWLKRFQNNAK